MGVAWHRFSAFFNIYFKREDDGGVALGPLQPMTSGGKPIDFEDPGEDDVFGRGKIEDFTWKGMLDFTTCTECGRCQSQCPAWNTGKPLSPKMVIMDLRDHLYAKAPYLLGEKTASETAPDYDVLKPSDEQAWASGLRPHRGHQRRPGAPPAGRHARGGRGHRPRRPVELHQLRRLRRAVPGRHRARRPHHGHAPLPDADRVELPLRGRRDAAQPREPRQPVGRGRQRPRGLDQGARLRGPRWSTARSPTRSSTCSGSAAPAPSTTAPRRSPRPSPSCCTSPASSSPSSARARPARATRPAAWATSSSSSSWPWRTSRRSTPPSRAACRACARSSRPARTASTRSAGSTRSSAATTRSSTTRSCSSQLVEEGRLTPVTPVDRKVTYHDPCFLGRHNKVYTPPREILDSVQGLSTQEMHRCKDRGFCCGAGGARMWMEEKIGKRINAERTEEALELDPDVISTACPFCITMLSDALNTKKQNGEAKDHVEVLDVSQILLRSMAPVGRARDATPAPRSAPWPTTRPAPAPRPRSTAPRPDATHGRRRATPRGRAPSPFRGAGLPVLLHLRVTVPADRTAEVRDAVRARPSGTAHLAVLPGRLGRARRATWCSPTSPGSPRTPWSTALRELRRRRGTAASPSTRSTPRVSRAAPEAERAPRATARTPSSGSRSSGRRTPSRRCRSPTSRSSPSRRCWPRSRSSTTRRS